MKKYFLLLALFPLSANGALRLFSLKNFGKIVQTLSQQQACISSFHGLSTPAEYLSPDECLINIILQELDRQGIELTDIDPHPETALTRCARGLLDTATHYQQTGWVGAYHELPVSDTALEAAVEYLRLLEK